MDSIKPSMAKAAYLISRFEGFRGQPYLDSSSTPTIGFGTTRYPDGRFVSLNDSPCSILLAEYWLEHDLKNDAIRLWHALKARPTDNQWAALLSLTYNIGWPRVVGSTAVREFNNGNLPAAADAFLLWDKEHVDGKLVESKGLEARRAAERTLFLKPE